MKHTHAAHVLVCDMHTHTFVRLVPFALRKKIHILIYASFTLNKSASGVTYKVRTASVNLSTRRRLKSPLAYTTDYEVDKDLKNVERRECFRMNSMDNIGIWSYRYGDTSLKLVCLPIERNHIIAICV